MARPRYRFGDFTVSPGRRLLLCSGATRPLIPRYFDLLLLLIERRDVAVRREEIFDTVWDDVVVSDGALTQAIRTLRRVLGDDVREPRFIRTVSRHGYQFIARDLVEEADDEPGSGPPPEIMPTADRAGDAFDPVIRRLLEPGATGAAADDIRREAASTLHALGTSEALARLDERPGHSTGRAFLRETRWDVGGAGSVPLLGVPGGLAAARALVGLRLRQAARLAGGRWAAASGGGALAGLLAGLAGGAVVALAPGSAAPASLPVAFGLVGAFVGGLGAAGVGAGLAVAEALARSARGVALVLFGALGGGAVGGLTHLVGRWTLEDIFGHPLSAVGGGFEGLIIGAAAGLGYALSTPRPGGGGMATPRGAARGWAALTTGICCALAGILLTWSGGALGGDSLASMARTFQGSQVDLAPLGRLFGETAAGPLTRTILGAYEGMLFGAGLVLGLTRRPRV